jgi:hypothetical protein
MAYSTVEKGFHRLTTTNWDYLLQREVDAWMKENHERCVPKFLGQTSAVYHLNGSVEPGDWQNRSLLMLETDDAGTRVSSHEANAGFNLILESRLIVIVGMSFECDTDRGLLAALRKHEHDMPIGGAHFVIVDPVEPSLCATCDKLAYCFPGGSRTKVPRGFAEWIDAGTPELVGRIFKA